MMFRRLGLVLAAAIVVPTASQAAPTYNVVTGYDSAVFAYGYGSGTTFTPFAGNYPTGGCFGIADFACHTTGPNNVEPEIGKNIGSAQIEAGSVSIPLDVLLLHPDYTGHYATGNDAVLQFIAPAAGIYSVNGFFERLDRQTSTGAGATGNNGVNVSIFLNGVSLFSSSTLSGADLQQFTRANFGFNQLLGANDRLSFVVNNNGDYFNDATGLSAQISAVPETATWGMMIAGFGVLGGALRRRRAVKPALA